MCRQQFKAIGITSNQGNIIPLSGWFISLPWFLSRHKNLEWWTQNCGTTDKLQLKHTDLLLDAPKGILILSSDPCLPLLYFHALTFGYAQCKVRFVLTTNQWKALQMGIHSRLTDNFKLYDSRLCCLYLHIIQSIIIRCRIVNIHEPLMDSWLPNWLRLLGEPPWLLCIHCVPSVHVQELKISVVIL